MLLAVCGLFASSEAFAQTPLVTYNFNGSAGSEDSLAADAQPANAFFSYIKRGSAIAGSAGGGYFTSNTWPTAFNANAYVRINARPNPGFSLTLTALALNFRHSSTGPATFEIRSSLDNYTTVLKTVSILPATQTDVRDSLALPAAFANLTSKVEFRIFGYGGTATGGSGRVDKIHFYGTVQSATGGPSPTLNFASATSTVAENVTGGTLSIPVTITNASATTATTVTVAVATAGGTATSPADYTITTGTLTFAAGSSANQNAVLTIVNDALVEGNETINLILSAPSTGAVLGANITHTVTITDDDATAPIVSFQAATATVSEAAGTISVPVTITNPNANPTSVTVQVASPAGTATAADYTFTSQTLTFPANSTTTQNATLTIIDDAVVDKNETIILTLANPTNSATIVGNATYTITITDNDLPLYTVAQVTTVDATTFSADSLNVKARLTGVLHGHNQRPAGLTFALIDNTGGIGLFKNNCTTGCPTAPLVQGDSVMVFGKIDFFNGLTQMAVDSIHFIAGNKTLRTPVDVTVLDESTESELIRIVGPLTLVDPADWTTGTGNGGFTVEVTDGTNNYDMRIDNDTDLYNAPAPTQPFSVVGLGGQFDSSSPYNSGYQIFPRDLNDILLITGVQENKLTASVAVYPNPAKNEVNIVLGEVKGATELFVVNTLGQVVAKTSFTNATTSLNVSNLPAGVYIIRLVQNNKTAVKQFVKIN